MHDDYTFGGADCARDLRRLLCALAALLLLADACLAQPGQDDEEGYPPQPPVVSRDYHPPGFRFWWLPVERVCELAHNQCQADWLRLTAELEVAGAWRQQELRDLRRESERRRAAWMEAWWITWTQANESVQEEHAEILLGMVGADSFFRGELPLPLSLDR